MRLRLREHSETDEELFRGGDDFPGNWAGAAAARHFQAAVALAHPSTDPGGTADGQCYPVLRHQNDDSAAGSTPGVNVPDLFSELVQFLPGFDAIPK